MGANEAVEDAWTIEKGRAAFEHQYETEGPEITLKESDFLSQCWGPSGYGSFNICLSRNLELWDEKLNFEYKHAMRFSKTYDSAFEEDESVAAKLLYRQRAWIKKRDATCKSAGDSYPGGSLGISDFIACRQIETAKRTIELWHRNDRGAID